MAEILGDSIEQFVPSPLFDNWFLDKTVERELVICSPFIKRQAVEDLLNHFKIIPGNPNSISIDIYTSGNVITYIRKSSDPSAIRLLSEISNVRIHLLANIHMKAYCIDKSKLLIGSGNWTPSGLFPQGNIEAALSTEDQKDIAAFFDYCKKMDEFCTILSTPEEIVQFCDELDAVKDDNSAMLEGMSDLEDGLSTESFTYKVRGYRIKKRFSMPRVVYKSVPTDFDEARKIIDIQSILDTSVLTPEVAYFLGGMAISGFEVATIRGKKKIITYYRLNASKDRIKTLVNDIANHANAVLDLISAVADVVEVRDANIEERKQFFGNKCGFITAFDYDEPFVNEMQSTIFRKIKDSPAIIQKAFLIGAFDCKGTADKTAKLFAMDSRSVEMGQNFNEIMISLGLSPTPVNSPRERENPDQIPRWPQIRLKLAEYFENIGIISPSKARTAADILNRTEVIDDSVLPNVRKL